MASSDDYTKEEDRMMWELHEVRKKISGQNLSIEEINRRGRLAWARFLARKQRTAVENQGKEHDH